MKIDINIITATLNIALLKHYNQKIAPGYPFMGLEGQMVTERVVRYKIKSYRNQQFPAQCNAVQLHNWKDWFPKIQLWLKTKPSIS